MYIYIYIYIYERKNKVVVHKEEACLCKRLEEGLLDDNLTALGCHFAPFGVPFGTFGGPFGAFLGTPMHP